MKVPTASAQQYSERPARIHVAGNKLFLGGGMGIKVLDLASREELWRAEDGVANDSGFVEWRTEPTPSGQQTFGLRDSSTGRVVLTASAYAGIGDATLVASDQLFFWGTTFQCEHQRRVGFIAAHDPATGKVQWVRQLPAFFGQFDAVTVKEGRVFLAVGPGLMLVVDRRTGNLQWRVHVLRPIFDQFESGSALQLLMRVDSDRLGLVDLPDGRMPPEEIAVVEGDIAPETSAGTAVDLSTTKLRVGDFFEVGHDVPAKGGTFQFTIAGRGVVDLTPRGRFRPPQGTGAVDADGASPTTFRFKGEGHYYIHIVPGEMHWMY